MNGPSIIVDPKRMFFTLNELQQQTAYIIVQMSEIVDTLQQLSTLTYAIGFGELIKQAEKEMNQVGHGMVAANNAFNTACKDIVNKLVTKFASEGTRSDYSAPQYREGHIKINTADRAAIYPRQMTELLWVIHRQIRKFRNSILYVQRIYETTAEFWIGASADKTRKNFVDKILPHFYDFHNLLLQIENRGAEWVREAVKFEASLGVQ